jgi:hypothetical protein
VKRCNGVTGGLTSTPMRTIGKKMKSKGTKGGQALVVAHGKKAIVTS